MSFIYYIKDFKLTQPLVGFKVGLSMYILKDIKM